jgi:hypothetical protein
VGGITAWYTLRLTEIGAGETRPDAGDLEMALRDYEARDSKRAEIWVRHFQPAD